MKRTRRFYVSATVLAVIVVLAVAQLALQARLRAQAANAAAVPTFQVDPLWPKLLPNRWVIGVTIGLSVDARDHIWVLHRPSALTENEKGASLTPPASNCCTSAPPVLEFDQAGNLVSSWGGPGAGYEWPNSEHGLYIDYKDNVWIGGQDAKDAQVIKFTRQGKFLMQIGHKGMSKGSNDTQNLGKPADMEVDPAANEVYVADGYGNKRVIVFDADTGAYKRHWGAYGHKPDDTNPGPYNPAAPMDQQFRSPVHCATLSRDGLVYVCDRLNNRIQVFQKNGTFVKEASINKTTLRDGAVWDVDFSRDAQQKFIYVPDAQNSRVHVLLRDTLQVVSGFGSGGHVPGTFDGVHNVAVDSMGNIYTVETFGGKRVQRFVYKGLGAAVPTSVNGSRQ